jgi:hypothetical protein
MDLSKLKISGASLALASDKDIEEAESKLKVTFPPGYREYVTTLGEGALGNFIRVYPPWRVLAELDSWRDRIRQYWFWDAGSDVLTDEQAEESIIIADTLNGDELIFHPSRSNRLLVLPRDDEMIFEAGANMFDAINWLCGSGKLTERFEPCDFEPFDSRLLELEARQKPQRRSSLDNQKMESVSRETAGGAAELQTPISSAEEVLRKFFSALETWENAAYKALRNPAQTEDTYFELINSLTEELHETAGPFVSDTFEIGAPGSFGSPAEYGQKGPRIVDVQEFQDTAEITTIGDNKWRLDEPKRIFRLVRHGASWKVDGLWEITKTGRRKRVKMFF